MKLLTFEHEESVFAGELVGDTIHVLNGTLLDLIGGAPMVRSGLTFTRDAVRLHAPLRPGKIIAIGRNYAEHAAELGNQLPPAPLIFAKFSSCVIGHGDTIRWESEITSAVDWEGELAVIIATRCKAVSEADAYRTVFGYTIANDVSARDLQLEKDSQWTRGKSLDTFCPLGPWIVTHDAIVDPQQLSVRTTVSGELMQNGHTSQMIFSIPTLIAYCSRMFTLEPGDVILTGTPSGVGRSRKPPRYLQDGDWVSIEIEGIGELRNPCKID